LTKLNRPHFELSKLTLALAFGFLDDEPKAEKALAGRAVKAFDILELIQYQDNRIPNRHIRGGEPC
jgi:hypothetical protein